jgi:signal peptidase I
MSLAETWRRFRGGPWRVAVAEESMTPALQPGDWLLLDPMPRRWPRRGSVVVVRQPGTGQLAIKRVTAGPGDVVLTGTGYVKLESQAWLLGDSRHYGPVGLEALVGRAWFRYWPPRRIGTIPRRRSSSARARSSIASKGRLRK